MFKPLSNLLNTNSICSLPLKKMLNMEMEEDVPINCKELLKKLNFTKLWSELITIFLDKLDKSKISSLLENTLMLLKDSKD